MTKAITEYRVPGDICDEAKLYMKALFISMKEYGIQWNGLDNGILNLIAYEYHKWCKAKDILMTDKLVLKESNARNVGVSKAHPAIKIMYDATSQLRLLYIEFGLTPKSRGNVDALQGKLFDGPLAGFIVSPTATEQKKT